MDHVTVIFNSETNHEQALVCYAATIIINPSTAPSNPTPPPLPVAVLVPLSLSPAHPAPGFVNRATAYARHQIQKSPPKNSRASPPRISRKHQQNPTLLNRSQPHPKLLQISSSPLMRYCPRPFQNLQTTPKLYLPKYPLGRSCNQCGAISQRTQ